MWRAGEAGAFLPSGPSDEWSLFKDAFVPHLRTKE
jgi:hypothetical protein